MDPGPQFIELLSWNDAGESHYLGPTKFDPPTGSENYAHSDFDHTPLLTASAYYNLWFVNGAPPAIKTEAIVWYYRPHPKDLVAASDPVPKPEGAETMDDAIYVAVFVPPGSKAASVIVTTGGEAGEPTAVAEGVNLVQVPLVAGETGVVSSCCSYPRARLCSSNLTLCRTSWTGAALLSSRAREFPSTRASRSITL